MISDNGRSVEMQLLDFTAVNPGLPYLCENGKDVGTINAI